MCQTKTKPLLRAGCRHVIVALICTVVAIIWMVGPVAVFSSRKEPMPFGTQNCTVQAYKGTVCRSVLGNCTLCLNDSDPHTYDSNSTLQFHRELRAALELQSALKNGTAEYQLAAMLRICSAAFDVTPSVINTANSTGRANESTSQKTCSKLFYNDPLSGLCRPTCRIRTDNGLSPFYAFHAIAIVGSVIALITSIFNYKVMWCFPSILLMYWLISGLLYNVIALVNCCTADHGDYFNTPNILPCKVQAIVLFFLAYLLGMFPVAHTFFLFWGVWFPLSSKDMYSSGRKKSCLHVLVLVFALAVPCVICASLIIVFSKGTANLDYALVPFYGICGVNAALVGLALWKLIKVQSPFQNNRITCTPELKLSTIFIYVVIISIATIIQHVLRTYKTYGYVDDYFLCESSGNAVCNLQPDSLNAAINGFQSFYELVFSLSPYVTLIYILPLQAIRTRMKKKLSKTALTTA